MKITAGTHVRSPEITGLVTHAAPGLLHVVDTSGEAPRTASVRPEDVEITKEADTARTDFTFEVGGKELHAQYRHHVDGLQEYVCRVHEGARFVGVVTARMEDGATSVQYEPFTEAAEPFKTRDAVRTLCDELEARGVVVKEARFVA